ncbi:TetR/AcrR family transcriptional regulator [Leptospira sp. GIMC2001]|uniref:TetR/AcrR family transcriptional regulator n=1 Tax=Leptospira sp. GIMC2001 TaxID=1513297 RepID=UPI002349A1E6|nr:TetR/AcrR family transcriptional regulator [Leptospira sp. GIMC2001]WCL49639.1 TetR/AcrR family transcriptional regulator [Leptospira sp. GIMC2001]
MSHPKSLHFQQLFDLLPDISEPLDSGREKLIQAAEIEFSQKGYHGASVLTIAKIAGFKQPLLNYHFGNKEGIWRAVIEMAFIKSFYKWRDRLMELKDPDPLIQLRQVIDIFIDVHISNPQVHTILLGEIAQPGPRLDWFVEKYMKPFHNYLDELITICTQLKLIKPIPKAYGSIVLTSILTAPVYTSPLISRIYDEAEIEKASHSLPIEMWAKEVLLNGILTERD